jgi:hypothetical protein
VSKTDISYSLWHTQSNLVLKPDKKISKKTINQLKLTGQQKYTQLKISGRVTIYFRYVREETTFSFDSNNPVTRSADEI